MYVRLEVFEQKLKYQKDSRKLTLYSKFHCKCIFRFHLFFSCANYSLSGLLCCMFVCNGCIK